MSDVETTHEMTRNTYHSIITHETMAPGRWSLDRLGVVGDHTIEQ
jgi:hypothetical protein